MKDDVFVGGVGKERLKLFLPALGLGDPAGRAESGLAGKEHPFLIPALRALIQPKAHCLGATGKHFGDVFGDRRAVEKFPVFFGNEVPVVGKDSFEFFPSDDLHRQVGEVLSVSGDKKSSTAKRLIAGSRWRQAVSHINGFTMYC